MADTLRIRFLDVGQGDAIVGILPGGRRAFIVDVCKSDPVLDFLDSEGITEVILFLTHSDRDHTQGVQNLLADLEEKRLRVLAIFFSSDRINANRGNDYVRLHQLIGRSSRRLSRQAPRFLGADFNTNLNHLPRFEELFHPVRIAVIHPEWADQRSLIGNTNESAGVLLVEYTIREGVVRRVLLTADVQLTGISLLIAREDQLPIRADVFKYPHHGAWPDSWPNIDSDVMRRTMADFLNRVMPSIVVFSVGGDNTYGHISAEALKMLATYGRESNRLRMVRWTEVTQTCLQPAARAALAAFAVPQSAGDIEVQVGDFPSDDYVKVSCASAMA